MSAVSNRYTFENEMLSHGIEARKFGGKCSQFGIGEYFGKKKALVSRTNR